MKGIQNGQAALSLVFLISILITLMGVTLAFLVISFMNSSYGFQAAQRALAIASVGAQDALIRLDRDKDFNPLPNPYTVTAPSMLPPCTGGCDASVTIVRDSPSPQLVTVTSWAIVSSYKRTVQAIVSVAS